MKEPWEVFEADTQELFGLDSSPGSGNQWNAPGDAVDNSHLADSGFSLLMDCKDTEQAGYRITSTWMQAQHDRARAMGKRFVMPIRFRNKRTKKYHDYAVIDLNDLAELVDFYRQGQRAIEEGDWA